MSLLERFSGTSGLALLRTALRDQFVLQGSADIAEEFVHRVALAEHPQGTRVITQGDSQNGLFFVLAGHVSIEINGRAIATRGPRQHVGEMALIDPKATRSATVVCLESVVTAHVDEANFTAVADKYPEIWRRIAVQLADRLRQRGLYVREKNTTPILFIGSSKESLPVVEALTQQLHGHSLLVRPWTAPGVFRPSRFAIEDLASHLFDVDFAALVLGPDDEIFSRDKLFEGPRDNVIFELGLFMGALDRSRVLLLVPTDIPVKIPTDLLGINAIRFCMASGTPDVATAVQELRDVILTLGTR